MTDLIRREDGGCRWPHSYLDPRLKACPNCNRPINEVGERDDG